MNICPNLSNKKVKAEFEKLTAILEEQLPGHGKDLAYLVWDKTGGEGLRSMQAESSESQPINIKLAIINEIRELFNVKNNQTLYDAVYDIPKNAAKELANRLGFELKNDSEKETFVDFARKVINILEYNIVEFNEICAKIATMLMPPDLKKELKQVASINGLKKDDYSLYEDILNALNNGDNWIQKEQTLFQKILLFISDLINKMLYNQEYYEKLIKDAALEIYNKNSKHYKTVIQEGFKQKSLDIEYFKKSNVYNIYKILTDLGASLDGSAAVRMLGTLYRAEEEDFHDLDFSKPYDDFSWAIKLELDKFFNNYKTATDDFKNKSRDVYMDLRKQMLLNCDEVLKQSDLYKQLSKYYTDIKVRHAAKTKQLGLFVTLDIDGTSVDIFYNKNVEQHEINGLKVTDFSVAFAAKLIMGRDKDVRDIINFHKFKPKTPEILRGRFAFEEAQSLKDSERLQLETDLYRYTQRLEEIQSKSYKSQYEKIVYLYYAKQIDKLKNDILLSGSVSYQGYVKELGRINKIIQDNFKDVIQPVEFDESLAKDSGLMGVLYNISKIKLKINRKKLKALSNTYAYYRIKALLEEIKEEIKNTSDLIQNLDKKSIYELLDKYNISDSDIYDGVETRGSRIKLSESQKITSSTIGVKVDEDYQNAILEHLKNDDISYSDEERKSLIKMAEGLFKYLNNNGFKIKVVTRPYSAAEKNARSSAAEIYGKYAIIYYVKQDHQESPFLTILHELLHVATSDALDVESLGRVIDNEQLLYYYNLFVGAINRDPEYRKWSFKILNAKSQEELDSVPEKYRILYHAEESAGEFLSSFINEKEIRDVVKNISVEQSKSILEWMMDQVVKIIRSIFRGYDNIKTENLLDDITNFLLNYQYKGFDVSYMDDQYLQFHNNNIKEMSEEYNKAIGYSQLISGQEFIPTDIDTFSFREISSGMSGIFRGVITSDLIVDNINKKQEKAERTAQNITKRFLVLYDSYKRNPNKNINQLNEQNSLFELLNQLKQTRDYAACSIALEHARAVLGQWDDANKKPSDEPSIVKYLYDQKNKAVPYSGVTPDKLVTLWLNSVGFYDDLITNYIPNKLNQDLSEEDSRLRDLLDALLKKAIRPMLIEAMSVVGDRIVDEIIDKELNVVTDEERENMRKVAKDWLHKNIMYGDINVVSKYLWNASYNKNPIIKMAFHAIQEAETKTMREFMPRAYKLTQLFKNADHVVQLPIQGKWKISLANTGRSFDPGWQKMFMELGKDGKPTGNFVQPINYGQYKKDLEEFVKNLNETFDQSVGWHYIIDETGAFVNSLTGESAYEEEWNGSVPPPYVTYKLQIDKWKCEHSNRRYTYEYYKERSSKPYEGDINPWLAKNLNGHGLSPRTLLKYEYIQENINYYLNLCTDRETGLTHPEQLSDDDRMRLDYWNHELEVLRNPFNEDGTYKKDEALQTAYEILAWQKWLGERLNTLIDLDLFKSELAKVEELSNKQNNPKILQDFYKYNSLNGIHPEFLSLTLGSMSSYNSNVHAKLTKNALLSLVKTKEGFTRDLEKYKDNAMFWINCRQIDVLIEDGKSTGDPEDAAVFEDNFVEKDLLYTDENGNYIDQNGAIVPAYDEANKRRELLTWQQYMINYFANKALMSPNRTIPGLVNDQGLPYVFNGTADEVKSMMLYLFSYRKKIFNKQTNQHEYKWVPLSIFLVLMPRHDTFYNHRTNRIEPTILEVPRGRYSSKSNKPGYPEYINPNYDNSDLHTEQPKQEYYDNSEAYSKVRKNKDVSKLFDALLDTMDEMWKAIGFDSNRSYTKLPQINANTMQILSRMFSINPLETLSALWRSATEIEENDDNVRMADLFITNPDGSVANDVPLRYIHTLKHPEYLTYDITSAVIMFVNMALNYKNKQEIDSKIKSLRYNMSYENRHQQHINSDDVDDIAPINAKNSEESFDSMTAKHMYGNQWQELTKPKEKDEVESTSAAKQVASWTGFGALAGAAKGAIFGLMFGVPGIGAAVGAGAFGLLGGLSAAAKNGLFNGAGIIKMIKSIQRAETVQMLGLNIFSQLVGFGDSSVRLIKESIAGKYFNIRDLITSITYTVSRLPFLLTNIGNPIPNTKIGHLMALNGVTKSPQELFGRLAKGRVRTIFSQLLMGGFSLLDYFVNCILLHSLYNNKRLYEGDNEIPKGFYTRYELEHLFNKFGRSKYKARYEHMMSKRTMWGALDKFGNVKEEYKDLLKDRDHVMIRSTIHKRSALYNGMNPDNDIPKWKQDPIGSLVGALRSWLTQAIQHLFVGGTDNVAIEFEKRAQEDVKNGRPTRRSKWYRKEDPFANSNQFAWDYETGTTQDQIMVGLGSSISKLFRNIVNFCMLHRDKIKNFTEREKYAVKDAVIYLAVLGSMMVAYPSVRSSLLDDLEPPRNRQEAGPVSLKPSDVIDYINNVYIPKEYYKAGAATVYFRVIEAQLTSMDPKSTSDILTSITAITSGLGQHLGVVNALADLTGASGHSLDEDIKRGKWKYYTRGERTFDRLFGFINNMHTAFTYNGAIENLRWYENTYGYLYKLFGVDLKKPSTKQDKGSSNKEQQSRPGLSGPSRGGGPGLSGPKRGGGPRL